MNSFYVTTPIYYVNALPHLGHAYTTILADCANRFHRLLNEKTYFLTGTDEHGDKIVQAAEKNGEDPKSYVDKISARFQGLWPELGVENNAFIRTTFPSHKRCVQRILQDVFDKGDIYFGEYGGYYCYGCECFYTEKELENGLCPDHLEKPTYIKEENYFFRMSKYQDWLKEHILSHPDFIQPRQYRAEVLAMLREPLDDLCISRPKTRLTWGIELPFDQRFVTYVWFDALINYVSALGWPDHELFRTFWPNAHHLVAKDILKPHAVFWPTMLKAAGIELYKGLRVHGYWKVDETKMSKSLGNVVDPLEMRKKYGLDGFRYFLMREMQLGHDGSFSEQALVSRFNADLANDLGNLFNRSLSMARKYFQGKVPQSGAWTAEDREIVDRGLRTMHDYVQCFQDFRMARGLETFWEFIRGLNKYIDLSAPWKLRKEGDMDRLATVMALVLAGLRRTALAVWPIMPDAGQKMCAQLGLDFRPEEIDLIEEAGNWRQLQPGTALAERSNLFPRQEFILEQEQITESKSREQEPEPAEAGYEDFQKLQLLTGKVLAAEKVKGTDKLLKLEVDLGEERKRTIVAGLAKDYAPQEIQGRQVTVVANLKPRKLRGILSQGMVLTVHTPSGLTILSPEQDVPPGSRIS
ncbi:MAG: methionine--tRNA ligase [Desulfohalobiaceae bacterium]|nr:methionine--tRNA ligase [Desulfohalobiaceae bacterium]